MLLPLQQRDWHTIEAFLPTKPFFFLPASSVYLLVSVTIAVETVLEFKAGKQAGSAEIGTLRAACQQALIHTTCFYSPGAQRLLKIKLVEAQSCQNCK